MASFLSHLSPVPAFSPYTGPYRVGTQELEIPASEFPSATKAPDPSITSVSFRIFYPCESAKQRNHAYWLPSPQGAYFRAYAQFLQASPRLATFLSYLPILRLIFYTTIPALRDAHLLQPPEKIEKWPVMIFSHGLGGTRNAYSHLTGSLASHGMVVVAPEHRDGSSPISYIHDENGSPPKAVDYRFLPHKPSLEVDEGRNDQLKIRLWELGLVHEALLKLDRGEKITNVAPESHQKTDLSMFASSLDVFTPGKISWAGHSFGAATVVQFVKSVFYRSSDHMNGDKPLFAPSPDSTVSSQITPSSPVTVLDLWTQPILSRSTSFLLEQPLPAYKGAGGSPPLAILSEAFFKWTNNLQDTKRAISPPDDEKSPPTIKPHLFYPIGSAHLSQSDFGPLLPWATKKIFKAKDPERTMRLNVRAILESLRRSGVQVADTSRLDMELEGEQNGDASTSPGQDHQILATDGSVKGWIAIPLDDDKDMANANGHAVKAEDPSDAVIQGEVMKE